MQGLAGYEENSGIYSLWNGSMGGYWAGEERDLTQVFTAFLWLHVRIRLWGAGRLLWWSRQVMRVDRIRVTAWRWKEMVRFWIYFERICWWAGHGYKTKRDWRTTSKLLVWATTRMEVAFTERNLGRRDFLGGKQEFNLAETTLKISLDIQEAISCRQSAGQGRGSGLETEIWDIRFPAYPSIFLTEPMIWLLLMTRSSSCTWLSQWLTYTQILSPLIPSYMTLGKLLNFLCPQYPHLQKGDHNSTGLLGLFIQNQI